MENDCFSFLALLLHQGAVRSAFLLFASGRVLSLASQTPTESTDTARLPYPFLCPRVSYAFLSLDCNLRDALPHSMKQNTSEISTFT